MSSLIQLSIGVTSYAAEDPGTWEPLFDAARIADQAGVDRLVVSDHVVFGERLEEYSRPEIGGQEGGKQPTGPDGHWLEPLTTLSVLAGMTSRIRLGTNILVAALRRPAVLAKQTATLDVLSGGRLDLGVGVGWQREEYDAAGLDFDHRGRLLDHTLEVCQTLWREQRAAYDSPELHFEATHMMPKPLQPGGVPVWVSGTINPRVVQRVARFGAGWIPWGPAAADPVRGVAEIRERLAEAGRDPTGLQVTGGLRLVKNDDGSIDLDRTMEVVPALAEAGLTDLRIQFRLVDGPSAAVDELSGIVAAFRAAGGSGRAMTAAPTDAPPLGFWKIAEAFPERLALVDPDEREISAGELLASCNQLVHGLRALGLQPGDAVAMLLPNGAEVFELYLAVGQAGFYLIPINWHLVGPEIAYIVHDCEAKVFVAHSRFAGHAKAAADEIDFPVEGRFAVGGDIDTFQAYETLKDGQPPTAPDARQMGLVMNYTSGTTGRPKGVRRALQDVDPETGGGTFGGMLYLFGLQPFDDNVHIVGSPLYHTAVLVFSGAAIHIGHTLVVMDKWSPQQMLHLIDKYKVTNTHMVPTQFVRLLGVPEEERGNYDVSSLRHMIHAAAPCPPDVKRQMLEWWGPVIDEYYAASEGGGTYVFAEEWLERPGTVGRKWPFSEVVILDDDGNELPSGQIGTVYMHMHTGNFEYFKDKEKTDKSFRGKFFTVGDAGYLDDDGWLFLSDRKIDMIISGGANIYPAEIESELIMHPKVADVAVFGIPHDDWGEEVKAVVEPVEGVEASPELEAEILGWASTRLAKFKTPKSIDFTNEMPRDPNGKLYKRKLRDPYWEGRERAI